MQRFRFCLATLLLLEVFALLSCPVVVHAQEHFAAAPEVRSRDHVAALTFHAVHGSRDSFAFNGQTMPPIIRVSPGDTLKITYVNDPASTIVRAVLK